MIYRQEPTIFIIFGITGDLSTKKLLPALFNLYKKNLLPEKFKIVGMGRRFLDRVLWEDFVSGTVQDDDGQDGAVMTFIKQTQYVSADLGKPKSYQTLISILAEIDTLWGVCSHKIFHAAVSPFYYETLLTDMSDSGLNISCVNGPGLTRILIEKPIGMDLPSALRLNDLISDEFDEQHVYRIDHYLGKEALWSMLLLHTIEPDLAQFINKARQIEVRLLEKQDIGTRGMFYDRFGAIRDVAQNHLLEMTALLLAPVRGEITCDAVRDGRVTALSSLTPSSDTLVRAQYDGFKSEKNISAESQTETYFKCALNVKNNANQRIILESGKGLDQSKVEVVVSAEEVVPVVSLGQYGTFNDVNRIVFQIQPESAIMVSSKKATGIVNKKIAVMPNQLTSVVSASGFSDVLEGYEKLYYDVLHNDQCRFVSKGEVELSWKLIDPIRKLLERKPLLTYKKGTAPEAIL